MHGECEGRIREGSCELNTQSADLRPAKAMLFQVSQMQLLNSEDRWIEEIDLDDKLATGISFYEGNQSIHNDFGKQLVT